MVLALAQVEKRVLVTFDKDFGEMAFNSALPAEAGIILFRIATPTAPHVADVAVLESRADWSGHFSVIEADRVGLTPLPGLSES